MESAPSRAAVVAAAWRLAACEKSSLPSRRIVRLANSLWSAGIATCETEPDRESVIPPKWLLAVENRLEGLAHYLLEDEMQEQVEIHRRAAAALAERIAELDGAVTGDLTRLLEMSGLGSFELPADTSDPPLSPTTRSSGCAS